MPNLYKDMVQKKNEIEEFYYFISSALFKDGYFKTIIEIGVERGGTSVLWVSLVKPDGLVYGIDLFEKQRIYTGTEDEKYIVEIKGDSHDINTVNKLSHCLENKKADMLFIDGDHTYEGVKQDYVLYSTFVKQGGIIAFHDIIDSPYHRRYNYLVCNFWNEIKQGKKYYEFIDTTDKWCGEDWGGIGVIINV